MLVWDSVVGGSGWALGVSVYVDRVRLGPVVWGFLYFWGLGNKRVHNLSQFIHINVLILVLGY